jgi:IgA-specific serine endopeptidase
LTVDPVPIFFDPDPLETMTMTTDPFTDLTPAEPPEPPGNQLAKLHSHELAIQRVEALATLTIAVDGEKTVDSARKAAKAVRCEIEACRKALNADALDWQRSVNDLAKRLTARVERVETTMERQLLEEKQRRETEIRRQQNDLHAGRLAELLKQHGDWGVSELRATLPMSLVGYTPESWSNMLDVVLPQRKREQELAAKQREAAEAAAAKLREEQAERERVAREERIARERDAHHERERQRVAEIARRDEEARIAREQSKALLEQRRQQWEVTEAARMRSLEYALSKNFFDKQVAMLDEAFDGQPYCLTEEQRNKIKKLVVDTIASFRRILELDSRPFVGG